MEPPRSSVDPKGRVKGLVIREILKVLKEQVGATSHLATIVKAMPPDWVARINLSADGFGMLPSTWYPMSMIHAMLDAMLTDLDAQERSGAARKASRAVIAAMQDSAHKSFFDLFSSPDLYMRYAKKVWGMYFDQGSYDVERQAEKRLVATTRGWSGHHVFLCETFIDISGLTFEKMSLKDVRASRMSCVAGGAPACVATIAWDVGRPATRPSAR